VVPLPAPGAPVVVRLATNRAATSLEIRNDAPAGSARPLDVGGGNGLRGARERVAELGGTVHSAATPAGGWLLSAEIPAEPAAARRRLLPAIRSDAAPDATTVAGIPAAVRRTED
jgi:signal transduction histidine kinase